MYVSSLRLPLNSVLNRQLDSLFELIKRYDLQITVSRFHHPDFAFSRSDLVLDGEFPYEFLHEFSRYFPEPIAISINVADASQLVDTLHNYSALVWNLSDTVFLGVSVLSFNALKTIFPFGDNSNFLKLLFFTPASGPLREYLIVKPKGLLRLHNNRIDFLLPTHRADFIFLWLQRIYEGNRIDPNWIAGGTSELSDELKIPGVDESAIANFDSWLNSAIISDLGDFNVIYRSPLKILGGH